ncbi:hypothetical protein DFH29DRAFT_1009432 [Suillus ampliporus]|nr:hypothetical protein DFH29DRAFT_1009432 [Suillus ampliporus]
MQFYLPRDPPLSSNMILCAEPSNTCPTTSAIPPLQEVLCAESSLHNTSGSASNAVLSMTSVGIDEESSLAQRRTQRVGIPMLLCYRQYNDILLQPPPSVPFSWTAQQPEFDPLTNSADVSNTAHTPSQAPPFHTARNIFGSVRQFFSSTPLSHDPEEAITLRDISYIPAATPAEPHILSEPHDRPFCPYRNRSSFELGDWYWNSGAQKSHQSFKELIGIIGHPDFDPNDV